MDIPEIRKPYLILVGDMEDPVNAKTALGLRDWAREHCLGQLRFNERAVNLGLPEFSPSEAAFAGAKTLVIGIAPPGGRLPEHWYPSLTEALDAGLDIASGLHQRLGDVPEIRSAALRLGRQLHDVRHSDVQFSVGTGVPRSGRRLLTVGTDCAVGKKYTALAITRALAARGHSVDFRATGQTGILISGRGVAVDAVIADFIAGAAEALSPTNDAAHWDIIEGQGSLFHPSYAAVTLGLVHGSQPDALVLCHDWSRKTIAACPQTPIVPLAKAIEPYIAAARLTNPKVRFVGAAINTAALSADEAIAYLKMTADQLRLPCVDPIRTGVGLIVEMLENLPQ